MTTPWDDLPPYEIERILALPFDDMIGALCSYARKESARSIGEFLNALGNEYTKAQIQRAREKWKAAGGHLAAGVEPEVPAVPTRETVLQQLNKNAQLGNAAETAKWAGALVTLDKVGAVDVERDTPEEWDRLTDLEAGVLVALTRKLNGERLTPSDVAWLAHLR